ncbi:transcriptional regulator [Reticulomyxa filosa]|uniref:Transcriptional regulator n=1 Tax=Reticulomyxa filosa TaxID=46433 RepID=X6LCN9_RETFI|nr:transcriptional regulator [Reticulomyxa filosa]|eukprot:ETN99792.1 transcriptional regulator [Reticulomyxa filosa]
MINKKKKKKKLLWKSFELCGSKLQNASNVGLESLMITLTGLRSGAKMRVVDFETNTKDMTMIEPHPSLSIVVEAVGNEAFIGSRISVDRQANVNVNCYGNFSCAFSEMLTADAEALTLQCNNNSNSRSDRNCMESVVHCPNHSSDDKNGKHCNIDCSQGQQNCKSLTIIDKTGLDNVNLKCGDDTTLQSCRSIQLYCGPHYQYHCVLSTTLDSWCSSMCHNDTNSIANGAHHNARRYVYQRQLQQAPTSSPTQTPTTHPTQTPTKPPTSPTSYPTTPNSDTLTISLSMPLLNSDDSMNPSMRFEVLATMDFTSGNVNYSTLTTENVQSKWQLDDTTAGTTYELSKDYSTLSGTYDLAYARESVQIRKIATRRLAASSSYYEVKDEFVFNTQAGYFTNSQYTIEVCNKGSGLFTAGHNYNSAKKVISNVKSTTFVANSPPQSGTCSISPSTGDAFVDTFTMSCATTWTDSSSSAVYVAFVMNNVFVASYFLYNTTNGSGNEDSANGIYLDTSKHQIMYATTLSTDVSEIIAIVVDTYGEATCINLAVTISEGDAFSGVSADSFFNVSSPQSSIVGSLLLGDASTPIDLNNASAVHGMLTHTLYQNGTLNTYKASQAVANLSKASSAYELYVSNLDSVSADDVSIIVNFSYSVVTYGLTLVDTLNPQDINGITQAFNVMSSATRGIGNICGHLSNTTLKSDPSNGTAGVLASQLVSSSEHVALTTKVINTTQYLTNSAPGLLMAQGGTSALDKTTVTSGLNSVSNVLSNFACSNLSSTNGSVFLDTSTQLGQLASISMISGEQVTITTPVVNVTVSRVSTYDNNNNNNNNNNNADASLSAHNYSSTACSDNVALPNSAFTAYQKYSSNVDCAVVTSVIDPYSPGLEQANGFTGIVVNVNVTVTLETAVTYNGDIQVDTYEVTHFPQICNPVVIQIPNRPWANYSDPKSHILLAFITIPPQCNGTIMAAIDNAVTCVCNHTTTFSLKGISFTPNINYVKISSFRSINASNLAKYPAGWVFVLVAVVVFAILLYVAPDVNDKPLISHSRGVWQQFRNTNWHDFRIGLEADILCSNSIMIWKILQLWYINIRCDHLVIGLFFRYKGTGYHRQARLFSFLAKLFTLTAVNALFYGNPTNPWGNDWIISFYASLIQMPLIFVKFCFKRYHTKEKTDQEELYVHLHATVTYTFCWFSTIFTHKNIFTHTHTRNGGQMTTKKDFCFLQEQEYKKTGIDTTEEKKREQVQQAGEGNANANNNGETQGAVELVEQKKDTHTNSTAGDGGETQKPLTVINTLPTEKKEKTTRWKPNDFETMDIETLTRVLKTSTEGESETTTQENVSQEIAKLETQKELLIVAEQKYLAATALRRKIMDKQYSWWHWCKYLAWTYIIVWIIVCAVITLVLAVRFDMIRDAQNGYSEEIASKCPSKIDIGDKIAAEYGATQRSMNQYVHTASTSTLNEKNGFQIGESVSRWLISILLGFFLSLFIWQPLIELLLLCDRFCVMCNQQPEDINELYFFANPSLLLTEAERNALVQVHAAESNGNLSTKNANSSDETQSELIYADNDGNKDTNTETKDEARQNE